MASAAPRYSDAPKSLAGLANATPRPGLETAFDVARDDLVAVLRSLRDDHDYQQLMEMAGVDFPDRNGDGRIRVPPVDDGATIQRDDVAVLQDCLIGNPMHDHGVRRCTDDRWEPVVTEKVRRRVPPGGT